MALEVSGYHLRGCLARSGVTSVHRAEAVGRPGRLLVIEHLRIRPDPASLAAVRHAAEVLGGLDHPNVLPLLDVVDGGSGIALVMPFTPGGSLAEAIDRAPAGLPPAMIAEVGARIADGLAAVHEHGLVHGAITARSVRFDVRGRPLLADTGTALLLHGGPPSPTAPEGRDRPHRPAAHDAAGDLRALGAVLAAALATAEAEPADLTAEEKGTTPHDHDGAVTPRRAPPGTLLEAIQLALTAEADPPCLDARTLAVALAGAREAAVEAAGGGSETATARGSVTTPGPARQPVGVGPSVRDTIAIPAHDVAAAGRQPDRWRRVASAVAAALVLLVPVVLVATSIDDQPTVVASPGPTPPGPPGLSDPPDPPAPATEPEPDAPAGSDTAPAPRETAPVRPRRPPPICPGLDPPPGDGAVLLADLDGRGCSTPVRWDGRELAVTTTRSAPRRYELLADGGDQLLFGDLNCDERDAPVLYRPGTGEVFVFDGLVAPGEEITVTGAPSGGVGGQATIVTDDTGCDRIRVDRRR